MNWFEAVWYANQLSARWSLERCYDLLECNDKKPGENFECAEVKLKKGVACTGYRLPTESEWELAARAGGRPGKLADVAWCNDTSGGTTHKVGQKQAKAWKLHDMLGNVWEWTWDWYGPYPVGENDNPLGADSGPGRVIRGGSWGGFAQGCRATDRRGWNPGFRSRSVGFRLVRTASP